MARLAMLTPQQMRVLMMLSEGLFNKQIVFQLGVSEATVRVGRGLAAVVDRPDILRCGTTS
jgi:DNA-binding NarL/FixJ family response regulator